MAEISKVEELYLLTILRLRDKAYGVTIRRSIAQRTSKEYTYGTIYKILEQLRRKGLVSKVEGEPSTERGGRRKLLYHLTPTGIQALKNAFEMQRVVWGSDTNLTIEEGYNCE